MTTRQIIGPQCYLSTEAPFYLTGLTVSLSFWCALFVLVVTMGFYLRYLNSKQEKRRVALGLPAQLKDVSIMSIDEAEKYKAELAQRLRENGQDESILYADSFDDMTDFENPMFMYVL